MNPWLEALGTLATILYASACVPLAYEAIRTGSTPMPRAASWTFFVANCLFAAYVFANFGIHPPFFIVLVEILCWAVVLDYTYFPAGCHEFTFPVLKCERCGIGLTEATDPTCHRRHYFPRRNAKP